MIDNDEDYDATQWALWQARAERAEARLYEVAQLCDESELVESRRVSDVLEAP